MERHVGARAAGAGKRWGAAQRLVTAGEDAQTKKAFKFLKAFIFRKYLLLDFGI